MSWLGLLCVVALETVAMISHRDLFATVPPFASDAHLGISVNLALADALCGKRGRISDRYNIAQALQADPHLLTRPVSDVVAAQAGSVSAYCASVDTPLINHENSLMLLVDASLQLRPNTSVASIGHELTALRMAIACLFGVVLFAAGGSVLVSGGIVAVMFSILRSLQPYEYSLYAFLLPLPLLMVSAYTFVLGTPVRSPTLQRVLVVMLGVLTGFATNMRSSYAIVFFVMFLTFVFSWTGIRRRSALSDLSAWLVVLAFIVGYAGFHVAFIRPLYTAVTVDASHNTSHAVAHSLVLGLALPDNELARHEGIRWNDGVGLQIARRTSPGVGYLTQEYERTLFRYYVSLWRREPREMLRLYWRKLCGAGSGVFRAASDLTSRARIQNWLIWCDRHVNGVALLIVSLVVCVLTFRTHLRTGALLWFIWALMAGTAAFVIVEAALIVPMYYPFYQSYLLFFIVSLPLLSLDLLALSLASPHQ